MSVRDIPGLFKTDVPVDLCGRATEYDKGTDLGGGKREIAV